MFKISNTDRKKIEACYKALQHYYLENDKKELDFGDKPFTNLLDLLHPIIVKHPYYSNDFFVSAVELYLRIKETVEDDLDDLILYIENHFNINKDEHFLVFPLQGSGLEKDVSFLNFHLITQKDENEILQQISDITHIDYYEVKSSLDHTRKSRSKDFLESSLMIIKVENQTENVSRFAYQMAQFSVDIFKLLHSAFGMESSIFRMAKGWEEENSHVAILAKDGWRRGHGFSWNAQLKCKIDIDFMAEEKYQKIFCLLFDAVTKKETDALTDKFINALILYGKATVQKSKYNDVDLALLLYITALESLLTEGFNEKRLRLSAIVPRMIDFEGRSISEVSEPLEKLYSSRNNFLHAGQSSYFSRRDEEMEFLERVTALVILKCFELDKTISSNSEKRTITWSKYVDSIFKDLIFGKLS
ncbi:hypothetical protein [Clostridium sulfidigenes]|uniref:hypothetical protein n=1 Tax=Clostridium sulfidigenes TaxID=318464 RepID=UPI003F886649